MHRGAKQIVVVLLMSFALGGCLPKLDVAAPSDGGTDDLGTGGNFVGVPSGPIADPAQTITVDALVPSWASTTILGFSPQSETLPMPMNHRSAALPAGAFSNCGNCHLNL